MTIRIPNRAYRVLERAYRAQTRIRREENRREVQRQDAAMRAHFARLHAVHDAGQCGGATGGCRFYPCLSVKP